ncbi:hypothetical protein EHP00_2111 [Ecytonucleospora hepatopenaei]|uniref:Uncharacterized protein n=1 Tax=Ecytonucleospora hepatopenaei TaxID=646526 RepID=A0A1W0E756_9MICR|nr:hypothetical protein EHP00_2111 [Ecytonucleospora hepatopenaei]
MFLFNLLLRFVVIIVCFDNNFNYKQMSYFVETTPVYFFQKFLKPFSAAAVILQYDKKSINKK